MSEIICRQILNYEELAACFKIRKQVFVDEQKLFSESDQDEHDRDAVHIAAVTNHMIIGTVRIYKEEDGAWVGGRLAVKRKYRGKAGKLLVLKAVEIVRSNNAKIFKAVIQEDNVPFFVNLKWDPVGDMFLHHGQLHQLMHAML